MTTALLGHAPTPLLWCVDSGKEAGQTSQHEELKVPTSAIFTEASSSIPRGDHSLSFAIVSTIICVVWCEFVCGDVC